MRALRILGVLTALAAISALTSAGCSKSSPPDTQLPDAGATDSGVAPDAGVDAGEVPDSGVPDAGLPDSGLPDSGPTEPTIDCAPDGGPCPELTINGDAPFAYGFHGYADPSMRKDPNSSRIYLAYSWPHVTNNTPAVDLHLAHSDDDGASFQFDGTLFASTPFTNSEDGGYAAQDQQSHEVIDILPMDRNGSTLWVQAHWEYLTAVGTKDIYGQAQQTAVISLSAVLADPAGAPTQLLGLATAPTAILSTYTTDPTLHPTQNLSSVDPAVKNCATLVEPSLMNEGDRLYLSLLCLPASGMADASSASFLLFSTQPVGPDATQWTWSYVGRFATPQDAAALGAAEGASYTFFTQLELVHAQDGTLMALASPAVFATSGQPSTHFGCRAMPMTSLSQPALALDANGHPKVLARVLESDLYSPPNQGNGACTYDPASSTGILIVHKLEADPQLKFYVTLLASGLKP